MTHQTRMDRLLLLAVVLLAVQGLHASESSERYEAVLRGVVAAIQTIPAYQQQFQRFVEELAKNDGPPIKFPCDVSEPGEVPTSVHRLRPTDVKVIAALGDSVTAGNGIGAKTAPEVLLQNRGESWSIGGDKNLNQSVYTLANVLKKFNPTLKGYSVGFGRPVSKNAWFNAAVAGAKVADLPGEADDLVRKMKADTRIDFNNDWKVITIMIGGNDMCDYCLDRDSLSAENFGIHAKDALDKLHANIPRALVNLVPMADISDIPKIRTGLFCDVLHNALCKCAVDDVTRPELRPLQLAFYDKLKDLADGGRYDTRDDFTVVLQPFLVDQTFPKNPATGKYDPTYIAPDCFHPSRKTHQGFSMLLWNTMLTPVEEKPRSTDLNDLVELVYKCPSTENPHIYTNQNSGALK